ncbi:MAG: NADH-quinone oxidoreductase subunit M [Synechococcaceae cyanobacterium SM2_3_1]|nr:NADH-quinone oxidoreductase subunit M [Synechococcaceae cyanobacterium SM2_3_1]
MLSALIWGPIVAAAAVGFWPRALTTRQWRWIALAIATVIILATMLVFSRFDLTDPGMQLREQRAWVPLIGLDYTLGVDGLSLGLLGLNALLTWIAISTTDDTLQRPRLFYALILLVNGAVAGAFLSQNLLLFFLFYELELIPFYLLIAIWGGLRRDYAAIKFLLYTAVSGILMLVGFLGLFWLSDLNSFDYQALQSQALPLGAQILLLITLLVAFGIKIPLIPFHTWLPDAYVEASPAVAILLGGILAKLGTYGLVRFCMGLFPDAWSYLAPSLAIWAVICILGGALTAISQKDIKRMVAYSSVGHMGYILLGCAASTHLALVGVVSQMVAHGLILALLFQAVGVIEAKVGTRELNVLNGLLNPIRGLPLVSALLITGGMASAAIPGMVGFVAEILIFQGSYAVFPWQTLVGVVGTGLTAVYFVIMINRACFGKLDNATAYYPKVIWSDRLPALILAVLILALGIQPTWLVRWNEGTTAAIVETLTPETMARTQPLTLISAVDLRPHS